MEQNGILGSISPFIGIVSTPIFCALADKVPTKIYQLKTFCSHFISPKTIKKTVDKRRLILWVLFLLSLLSTLVLPVINEYGRGKFLFWYVLGQLLVSRIFLSPSTPILDSITIKLLGEKDKKDYGKVRARTFLPNFRPCSSFFLSLSKGCLALLDLEFLQ